MTEPPRQDDRGEGAAHAAPCGIDAALIVDPAVGGLQRAGGTAPHAERLRQRIVGVDETAHRKLGRLAAALVAADAVGDGADDVAVGDPGVAIGDPALAEAGRDVIFVGRALASLAGETDANPEISLRPVHHA